jgi:hypothetical protein
MIMNRGAALKWIASLDEASKDENIAYDVSGLGYDLDGKTYRSPLGILATFMNPEGWSDGWMKMNEVFEGDHWKISQANLKKCKVKSDIFDIYDMFDTAHIDVIVEGFGHVPLPRDSFETARVFVLMNYESI